MSHHLIKATVALCVLGGFALTSQAYAAPVVIPVIDEQDAVEEALEPEVMLPGSQEDGGAAPHAERGGGENDDSAGEIPALQEEFPSTDWPKKKE